MSSYSRVCPVCPSEINSFIHHTLRFTDYLSRDVLSCDNLSCDNFSTRQFITTEYSQTTIYHDKNIRKRHFVTPQQQFVTRQFVTMTICHDRRLRHFLTRHFVTLILLRQDDRKFFSDNTTFCHILITTLSP